MKKLLILTASLLTSALTLPTAAKPRPEGCSSSAHIFISGYSRSGAPIYSKRVRQGQRYRSMRLWGYELQRYLDNRRRTSARRHHSHGNTRSGTMYQSHCRSSRYASKSTSNRRR